MEWKGPVFSRFKHLFLPYEVRTGGKPQIRRAPPLGSAYGDGLPSLGGFSVSSLLPTPFVFSCLSFFYCYPGPILVSLHRGSNRSLPALPEMELSSVPGPGRGIAVHSWWYCCLADKSTQSLSSRRLASLGSPYGGETLHNPVMEKLSLINHNVGFPVPGRLAGVLCAEHGVTLFGWIESPNYRGKFQPLASFWFCHGSERLSCRPRYDPNFTYRGAVVGVKRP